MKRYGLKKALHIHHLFCNFYTVPCLFGYEYGNAPTNFVRIVFAAGYMETETHNFLYIASGWFTYEDEQSIARYTLDQTYEGYPCKWFIVPEISHDFSGTFLISSDRIGVFVPCPFGKIIRTKAVLDFDAPCRGRNL